jgi:hypothetical protein
MDLVLIPSLCFVFENVVYLIVKSNLFLKAVNTRLILSLKVHKNENFLSSILNFVLFHCWLCINIKILGKTFFCWTSKGGSYDYSA